MNGKTNDPPGGYSMEAVTLRPPYCFACAYSRNVWQVPRTGDALPGGKVQTYGFAWAKSRAVLSASILSKIDIGLPFGDLNCGHSI